MAHGPALGCTVTCLVTSPAGAATRGGGRRRSLLCLADRPGARKAQRQHDRHGERFQHDDGHPAELAVADGQRPATRWQAESLGPAIHRRRKGGERMTVEGRGPATGRLGKLQCPARGRRLAPGNADRARAHRHDRAAVLDDPHPRRRAGYSPQLERRGLQGLLRFRTSPAAEVVAQAVEDIGDAIVQSLAAVVAACREAGIGGRGGGNKDS